MLNHVLAMDKVATPRPPRGHGTTTQGSWRGVYGAQGYDIAVALLSIAGLRVLPPARLLLRAESRRRHPFFMTKEA